MVEFPAFDDVVGYVRESLGSSAHDYDVAAIAEEISAYDGVKNAMVITAHRGEFWSVVEKHYYYLDSRVPKYDLDDLIWSQYGVPEKMKAAECAVLKDRGGVADMLVVVEYDYHTRKASLMAPMSEHYLCDYWAHSDVPATFDRLDELFGPGQWEKFLEAFATYHERSSEDGGNKYLVYPRDTDVFPVLVGTDITDITDKVSVYAHQHGRSAGAVPVADDQLHGYVARAFGVGRHEVVVVTPLEGPTMIEVYEKTQLLHQLEAEVDRVRAERDQAIVDAVAEGKVKTTVGVLAGIKPSSVHSILVKAGMTK